MDGACTAVWTASGAQPAPVKLLLTVDGACAALGIKKTQLYGFPARGELLSVKVGGGRRLVPVRALHEFVERLAVLQKVS